MRFLKFSMGILSFLEEIFVVFNAGSFFSNLCISSIHQGIFILKIYMWQTFNQSINCILGYVVKLFLMSRKRVGSHSSLIIFTKNMNKTYIRSFKSKNKEQGKSKFWSSAARIEKWAYFLSTTSSRYHDSFAIFVKF